MTNSKSQPLAQEQLELIEDALTRTRLNISSNSGQFLFWGWLVIVSCLAHFALLSLTSTPWHWLPWPVLMTFGAIVSFVKGMKDGRKQGVSTHVDRFMAWLWATSGLIFFVTAFMCMFYEIIPIPFMLAISGMATFISGGVLRFKPLIIGGIMFFICSLASLWIPSEWILPFYAMTIVFGYLIPGYLLKNSIA